MDQGDISPTKSYEARMRDRQQNMVTHRWSYLVWSAVFETVVGGFLWFAYAKKGQFFGAIGWRVFAGVAWMLFALGALTFLSYVRIIVREARKK